MDSTNKWLFMAMGCLFMAMKSFVFDNPNVLEDLKEPIKLDLGDFPKADKTNTKENDISKD